jgi:DNA-binding response OmpR family regulator
MRKSNGIPLSTVRVIRGTGGSRLYIGKKRVTLPPGRHTNLIECFLTHAGRVVPYETLSAAMQWGAADERFRHCLRQYILQLRTILRKEKVHAHFAVAESVGYALCEPAANLPDIRFG